MYPATGKPAASLSSAQRNKFRNCRMMRRQKPVLKRMNGII